jgi:sterol 3beta-glucosyltransferase
MNGSINESDRPNAYRVSMRIVVTNFGSIGDFHPYLALAVEFLSRGHQPLMAFPPHFRELIERTGLEFTPIGPDLKRVQGDIITAMHVMPESAEELRALFSPLAAALPQMFQELKEACRGADVLVSGPMQPSGRMIHELTGIPFVSVQENHFGGAGSAPFQQATMSLINPFRRQLGLPPLRYPLTIDANSPQLALYAMSKHVFLPPDSWPSHYHVTGYFFFVDESYQPDPEIVRFIESGDAPVVVTFGSMTHADPERVTDILIEAIEMAGRRAIIQQGWSGLARRPLPPMIYAAEYVLHTWLFAHASCVVHHGGPGTAAAAFRAGAPSIFVPHTFDQPVWADLARDLGTVPPIPILELTAERLAEAITTTLSSPQYRHAAETLSRKIKSEQGVKTAAELTEQLVYKIGLHEKLETRHSNGQRADEPEGGASDKIDRKKLYVRQQRLRRRI